MGTYENIERACRERPLDDRSAQQRAFEKNSDDVRGLLNRMARYCADPRWAQNPKTVWLISDMSSELERKLSAIRLDAPVAGGVA
jgi:hypothetical protein